MSVRAVASVLAAGGVLWGLFCFLLLLAFSFPPAAVLLFAPGYFITLGYLYRAISLPPFEVRSRIWMVSLLVQGAWLLWAMSGVVQGQWFRGFAFAFISLGWWIFAVIASVYCAMRERSISDAPQAGSSIV